LHSSHQDAMDYSGMRVDELKAQLSKRGLPTSGKKAELVERLDNFDSSRTLQAATEAGEGVELSSPKANGEANGEDDVEAVGDAMTDDDARDAEADGDGDAKEGDADAMKDDATTATPVNTPAKPKDSRKRRREEVIPADPTVFFVKMSPLAPEVEEQDIIDALKAELEIEVKEVKLKRLTDEKKPGSEEEEETKKEDTDAAGEKTDTAEAEADEASNEKTGEAGDEESAEKPDAEMADAEKADAAEKKEKKPRQPWALVSFGSEEDRDKALTFGGEIKGHTFESITEFYRHQDKVTLFIANVPQPKDMSDEDLKKRLTDILGKEPPFIRRKLRKNFIFLTYPCMRDAKAARAKLEVASVADNKDTMRVEYSTPENKRPYGAQRFGMQRLSQSIKQEFSRTIYVRNIPLDCTDEEFRAHIDTLTEGDIEDVKVPRRDDGKPKRYAFIKFKKASDAMKLTEDHDTSKFKDETLEFSIADATQSNTRGTGPNRGRGRGRGGNAHWRGAWGAGPSPRGRGGRGRGRGGRGGFRAPPPAAWGYEEPAWGYDDGYGYAAPPPPAAYGAYASPRGRGRGRARGGAWGSPSPRGRGAWGSPSPRGRAGVPRARGGRGGFAPRGRGWGAGPSPRGRTGRGRGRGARLPAAMAGGQAAGGHTMAFDRATGRYVPLSQEQVHAAMQDPYYGY